jgi:glycosyltransferase involved in cell wall biosynthesis
VRNIPIVSICCITYNHKQFIGSAIEGFLKQKCNFQIEIIIHDDASTDGTDQIIKEYKNKYPDLIIPIIQKENQYSKGIKPIFEYVFPLVHGKYIALCEGDDYWIDPYKLQKQVDFMENNPNYGLCYSKAKVYDQEDKKFNNSIIGDNRLSTSDLIIRGNGIPTVSTLFRRSLWDSYIKEISKECLSGWLMGDYPLWLYISGVSNIYFFNEITCVYRKLLKSASHYNGDILRTIDFTKSGIDIGLYFSDFFKLDLSFKLFIRFTNYIACCYCNNLINKKEMNYFLSLYERRSIILHSIRILLNYKLGVILYKFLHFLYKQVLDFPYHNKASILI